MELIDTHAHLYTIEEEGNVNIAELILRIKKAGISQVYMPNIDLNSLPKALAIEKEYPKFCKTMIGLHPCSINKDYKKQLNKLEKYFYKKKSSFAAIGEVGLDFYHDKSFRDEQIKAFETQIGWSSYYGLPMVLHCRDAFSEMIEILKKHQNKKKRAVFHCFTGSLEEAMQAIDLGFYIGVGGILTFEGSELQEVVKEIPLNHIVLETDSPYLAPTPHRGKPNEPTYLPLIAKKVAELKEISIGKVAKTTTQNAKDLFSSSPYFSPESDEDIALAISRFS